MEDYEKFMLEKGKEKIDYDKIGLFYINIIYKIYETIENEYQTPAPGNIYSDEYLDAYGILQKAEWGISDIRDLKEYSQEPDFKYFAITNLYEARNRIHKYLEENTDKKFNEEIQEYTKYDNILEIKTNLEKDKDYAESYKKYKKIGYQNSEIKHIQQLIDNIKKYTDILKNTLNRERIHYIETENLLETIKLLEKVEKDLIIIKKE